MKKTLCCGIAGLFLLGLLFSTGFAQDEQKILDKMIEAMGGRKVIEGIKDVTSVGDMDIVAMGITGTTTMYTKEPNKMRMDLEFMGMGMTQAFDGEVAWGIDPNSGIAEEMPEEAGDLVKKASLGNAAFLNPKKYGLTYKAKGKEEVDGKEYLLLDRVYEDGYTMTFYIDPETYLIYKSKAMSMDEMMAEVEEETVMTDYKKVNGIMTAFTLQIFRDGEEFVAVTLTEVTYNTGLEDSLFKIEE
jgi:outer membrane lipoprotein-sorting protein